MPTTRHLLIVEDNPRLREQYARFCDLAVRELSKDGLSLNPVILRASNYAEANQILQEFEQAQDGGLHDASKKIDFASVDLALSDKEMGLGDYQRETGSEASGMLVLQGLAGLKPQPLAIVVSGESLISYATDTLQMDGVLGYFQKSRMDPSKEYKNSIKAALWFLEASDMLDNAKNNREDHSDISLAKIYWDNAIEAAGQARISKKRFPVDIDVTITREFIEQNTGLPKGPWARQLLTKAVVGYDNRQWSILQIRLANYQQAGDTSQINGIFLELSQMIKEYAEKFSLPEYSIVFLGTDYVASPCLVLIGNITDLSKQNEIAHRLEKQFNERAPAFTNTIEAIKKSRAEGRSVAEVQREMAPRLTLNTITASEEMYINDWPELLSKLEM